MKLNDFLKTTDAKILFVCVVALLALSLIPVTDAACADMYTLDANVTTGTAELRAVINISQPTWFEFGGATGVYTLQTKNSTPAIGNHTVTVKGSYLIPGETYYYRVSCQNCSGDEKPFTLTAATPVPTQTFSTYVTEVIDAEWNFTLMLPAIAGPYEDAFAALGAPTTMFYAVIWIFLFVALWLRQENMQLPIMLFILLLPIVAFSGLLPGDWIYLSYLAVVVSIGTLFYYLYKGRG